MTPAQMHDLVEGLGESDAHALATLLREQWGGAFARSLAGISRKCGLWEDLPEDFVAAVIDAADSYLLTSECCSRGLDLNNGDEPDFEEIAVALGQLRAGDLEAAEQTLIDACPGADLDAHAHQGRAKMLFDLRGKR